MNDQQDNEWLSRRLSALIEQRSKLYRDLEKVQGQHVAGETRGRVMQSINWQIRDLNNAIDSYKTITDVMFYEVFFHECASAIPSEIFNEIRDEAKEAADKERARLAGVKDLVFDKPKVKLNGSIGKKVAPFVNPFKPWRVNAVLKKVPLV
jgi:hypothetical protein